MNRFLTVGLVVVAGAALFEAALIPGVVIGGAAVLAPRVLPTLRRRLRPLMNSTAARRSEPAAARPERNDVRAPQSILPKFAFGQAIAKTITFRIIVTSLDFTMNYVVIGELGTAAGLSTFNLVAGPLFYLGHEAAWNYFGPSRKRRRPCGLSQQRRRTGWGTLGAPRSAGRWPRPSPTGPCDADGLHDQLCRGRRRGPAVILSSSGFILGPFVYYGHEKVWDYFTSREPSGVDLPPRRSCCPRRIDFSQATPTSRRSVMPV